MADPDSINCPQDQWTKIADNQTSGAFYIKDNAAIYSFTTRDAGNSAPVGIAAKRLEGLPVPDGRNAISDPGGIDVYIFCERAAGRVIVVLPT